MADTVIMDRPVIAITGSSGKTTTKEMIAAILQKRWNMFKSNQNGNDIWVIQSRYKIFKSIQNGNDVWYTSQYAEQIDSSYQAVVLEYGLRYPGDITKHCKLIQPNIGIITNVGSAHIGNFNGQGKSAIAAAKSELISGMKPDGLLLLNADDPNSKLLDTTGFKGEIILIGLGQECNYYAEQIIYTDTGMRFQVKIDGVNYTFTIPFFGKHHVYNALFAIAITHRLGCTVGEIQHGLETFCKNYPDYFQMNVRRFKHEISLMFYTYSSKTCAMKAAVDVLVNIGTEETVAFLGDMLGLGDYSIQEHKEVGCYIAARNVAQLYTFGTDGKYIGEGAIEAGFPADKVMHICFNEQLINTLKEKLQPKTTFLIMGFMRDEEGTYIGMRDTVDSIVQHCQSI